MDSNPRPLTATCGCEQSPVPPQAMLHQGTLRSGSGRQVSLMDYFPLFCCALGDLIFNPMNNMVSVPCHTHTKLVPHMMFCMAASLLKDNHGALPIVCTCPLVKLFVHLVIKKKASELIFINGTTAY